MSQYLPILCMIILVVLFGSGSFLVSTLLAPRRKTTAKTAPYEGGIVPEEEPSERFPVKFYLVAMIFIILDVEIIFLYPFTLVFRDLAGYGLVAMGIFLLALLVPFGYLLSTGALDWGPMKKTATDLGRRMLRVSGMPDFSKLPVPEPVEEEAA
ncbi:MAG: NADH-quinone oxidoreductase subunit A [Acidimicrobiia bacterium]